MKRLLLFALLAALPARAASEWPQFRGPGGLGVAGAGQPPVHFGSGSNVLWQTALPSGNSSPVVTGDRIFLTAFDQGRLETLCLDRRDGKILWHRPAPAAKIEPTHNLGSPATPTPVTDGARVFVYFGSFGLLCYDLDGQEQWRHPLSAPVVEFGASASPILAAGLVIQVCDQDLGSFLIAVRPRDGATAWRVERGEFRRSFATPFLWRHDGAEELIVPGSLWLKSYSPKDGSEIWTYSGTSRVACSTPAAEGGHLFSASWNVGGDEDSRITMPPFEEFARKHDANQDGRLTKNEIPAGPVRDRFTQMDLDKDGFVTPEEWRNMADMFIKAGNAVLALRPGGRGDITATHLAWKTTRSLPYVSSPVCHRGRLYTVKNGGLASCYDAATGKIFFQDERLGAPGDYYSSAVAADGKIFIASQKGVVVVFEAADKLNVLARNDLAEQVMATPAFVDGKIYLRTAARLYAFGSE